MKRKAAKKVNQTFSIPIDLVQELHVYIKRREMSLFVSEAIRKELLFKKNEIRKAYLSANEDEGQQESMKDWESTLEDGRDEW